MMKLKLICFFCLIAFISTAQKKKELKKYGIKTLIVTETQGQKTINDSKTVYNSSGLAIEETNYGKDGLLKTITKFKYNASGDVTEELEYDDKAALKEKRTFKYNALGEKTEELVCDGSGKQIKKTVYTYDLRGFKSGKQIYDANNNLVTTKKMVYSK